MKTYKLLFLAACAAFIFVGIQQTAQASPWNERTILHVHNPIQVPGAVLTPGTYVVQLAAPTTGRDVVQIKNRNDNQVVATVIAIPDQKYPVSGNTKVTFYEASGNNPPALRTWFYPGKRYGYEFVYPQSEAQNIANSSNRYVPTISDTDMQNFQQQASNDTSVSPTCNARIYRSSPNGTQVSNQEGLQNNQRLDQNPNSQQQQTYRHYADFESGTGQ